MTAPWDDPRVAAGLDRQLEARARLLDDGAVPIGWKVGFGAPNALASMQIDAPLLGYLTTTTLLESGDTVQIGDWERGIVEFEVAVWMATDLGAGASDDEARAAVGAVGPAIELADIDLPIEAATVPEIMAGDIFHRGVVLGPADPGRAGLDIDGLEAQISIDGRERARTADLEAITGSYPRVVATVAGALASRGERLRADDVIITGSVIPPIPVTEGSTFTFTLDPFDPIAVSVT